MPQLLTYIILITMVVGCGQVPQKPGRWINPNRTQERIKSDHFTCAAEAWKQHPKEIGDIDAGDGYWEQAAPARTECRVSEYSGKTFCSHTPATAKKWVPSSMKEGDINAEKRGNYYVACMIQIDSSYQCIRDGKVVSGLWCGKYND